MYRYELHFRRKKICVSELIPIKGWASALARNTIWRLQQEWDRVGYVYKVEEIKPIIYEVK